MFWLLLSLLPALGLCCPKCPAMKVCSSSPDLQALVDVRFLETESGKPIYGGCNIPSPRSQPLLCGLPGNTTDGWLCDPNNMLTPHQVSELQTVLQKVNNKESYCRCGDACKDTYIPNPIMLAIIQHMRMPDLSDSKCKTKGCYDVHPQRDPTSSRAPAESEINKGLESFQYNLPERWKEYKCNDFVYIVYTALNRQFNVYYGAGLPVSGSVYTSAIASAQDHLAATSNLQGALVELVETLAGKVNSRDNTMLVIGLVCVGVLALLMIFGVVITFVYCRKERAQGKTYGQILRREAAVL